MTRSAKGTALVTGASSGIGAVYAERLARRGYDLILVARDRRRLNAVASTLHDFTGIEAEVLAADLTKQTDLPRVEQRLREDPAITVLVNNAGMSTPAGLAGADLDRLEDMIRLNIVAVTRLAGAAATNFVARGRGTIINIASVLALLPEHDNGVYGGTKAYVLNLSCSMHEELSGRGVQVQAVLPGATRTEIWRRSGDDLSAFPANMIMNPGELVDAALVGLDRGELVTIPSLPDVADWEAFTAARRHLRPNLSHDHAADRYRQP